MISTLPSADRIEDDDVFDELDCHCVIVGSCNGPLILRESELDDFYAGYGMVVIWAAWASLLLMLAAMSVN